MAIQIAVAGKGGTGKTIVYGIVDSLLGQQP